ncbi:transcription factor LRL2 [Andrographis paniculata]|uniref:transcription factor LRL2 n=1 Tax=Andrographis paniculata TaxID=175694 RepID=UPI0021E81FC3|nr:transcription factor LRL2 [Andrographis paniculata]
MDNDFQLQVQPQLHGVESSSAVDEAYINGVCAGLSFRSLLAYGSYEPAAEAPNPLKMPKTEPNSAIGDGYSTSVLPYNFFSEAAASSSSSSHHLQLPSLLSLELPPTAAVAADSPVLNPRAGIGKQRRRIKQQRLSDKTRCLQKLLPWDEKMDMATVLEEAYKYIRFLQAQVSVLQSMPCETASASSAAATSGGGGGVDLGRLNRQQLLQVVVNSPVAQSQLYSKGCCVYSVEQIVTLKKKQAMHQQVLLSNSSNPNSFF